MVVLTHLPPSAVIRVPGTWLDELIHGLLFTLLSLLGCWALRPGRASLGLLALGLVCFAVLDEWTQGLVGRTPDLRDWVADVVGVLAGAALYGAWVKIEAGGHRRGA